MKSIVGPDATGLHKASPLATGLLGLLLIALIVTAGASSWKRQRAIADSIIAQEQLQSDELFALRIRMAWLHHDMLLDQMFTEVLGEEIDTARHTRFLTERKGELVALAELEAGSVKIAPMAQELAAIFDEESFDATPYIAAALDTQHYDSGASDIAAQLMIDRPRQNETFIVTMLPAQVLADALTVDVATRGQSIPTWAAEYVDFTYGTLIDAPGWLGPERANPLANHFLLDNPEHSSPLVDQLSEKTLTDLQQVWDYDQWLIAGTQDKFRNPPPMTIETLQLATQNALGQLRADALSSFATKQSGDSNQQPMVWLAIAASAFLGAALTALVLVRRLLRRQRHLTDAALADPLTGAHNRRYLDYEVAERCRRINQHHVIAMIDLDRFKMVNDTWGHDVGDALLVTLTQQLQLAATDLCRPSDDSSSAVVRPGGDEFIVALHTPTHVPLDVVESRLRSIAGPVDVGLDEPIDLQFSLGMASADGPTDLSHLLKTADLATYEDKASRASERRSSPRDTADI